MNVMADLHYTREKFAAGVTILTTHPGRIKERLDRAYAEHVMFATLEDATNIELSAAVADVHRTMTRGARVGAPTIETMNEDEAIEVAQDIMYIAEGLRRACRGEQVGWGLH